MVSDSFSVVKEKTVVLLFVLGGSWDYLYWRKKTYLLIKTYVVNISVLIQVECCAALTKQRFDCGSDPSTDQYLRTHTKPSLANQSWASDKAVLWHYLDLRDQWKKGGGECRDPNSFSWLPDSLMRASHNLSHWEHNTGHTQESALSIS